MIAAFPEAHLMMIGVQSNAARAQVQRPITAKMSLIYQVHVMVTKLVDFAPAIVIITVAFTMNKIMYVLQLIDKEQKRKRGVATRRVESFFICSVIKRSSVITLIVDLP